MDGVSFENNNDQFNMKVENSSQAEVGRTEDSTLFGMTCDGMDIITKSI